MSTRSTGKQLSLRDIYCKLCTAIGASLATFTFAPKREEFVSGGNHKLARCIWFLFLALFIVCAALQIRFWFQSGIRPPMQITETRNLKFFAPNMQICNEMIEARPIRVKSIQVYEFKTQRSTHLIRGEDFTSVQDCQIAAQLCDQEPPVGCPKLLLESWPIDPKTGLRAKQGSPLYPLSGCVKEERSCTRIFMNQTNKTKLLKKEKEGIATEMQVTLERSVDPRQWFFRSGISRKRCLYSAGDGNVHLGENCDVYILNDDSRAMFQFYARPGESAVIKERGGNCLQADPPKHTYAALTPCEFAMGVRFHLQSGLLVHESISPGKTLLERMCLTQGAGHSHQMININWGKRDIIGLKVFWELCADRSNDRTLSEHQTWKFDAETGFLSTSVILPRRSPKRFCLMMSDDYYHWSAQTELLALMPCDFVAPKENQADSWWKDADLTKHTNGSAWVEVTKMEKKTMKDNSATTQHSVSTECKVETQVMPGKKFTGTSRLVCHYTNTACVKRCGRCAPTCWYLEWLGDGNCHHACNNSACNFDCNANACDCDGPRTTLPSPERISTFREKVRASFSNCEETCQKYSKSHTNYLRYRWQTHGEENEFGILIRLSDKLPKEGCKDKGMKGCYAGVYKGFASSDPPPGGKATWCLSAYKGENRIPTSPPELVSEFPVAPPKQVSLQVCHPQRDTQRFYYEHHTGLIRGKAGRCMTLASDIICRDGRNLQKPMTAIKLIPLKEKFASLKDCGEAVIQKRKTDFDFRGVSGATYTTDTQACAGNFGHVETEEYAIGSEVCHFDAEEANPVVAFTTCDMSDARQNWQVTPQKFFAASVQLVPPQTQTIVGGIQIFFRVLYEKIGLKAVVDVAGRALNPPWGFKGLWGQLMPLDLRVPGEKDWDESLSTITSRNQMYALSVDAVEYGDKGFWSLQMPWTCAGASMHMPVRRSDLVIVKSPSESLRTERIYIHVSYHTEQIKHFLADSDLVTSGTTMLAVITAIAGLMKCWQFAFPMVETNRMTIQGSAFHHLKEELEKQDVTTDDIYEDLGVDIPYHLEQERRSCCPWFFSNDDPEDKTGSSVGELTRESTSARELAVEHSSLVGS